MTTDGWTDWRLTTVYYNTSVCQRRGLLLSYANDICVPRKILRDIPDLSYVQPEGNYYFKTSDSYQILQSCSINISDCLKSPGTCDSSPCITTCKRKTGKNNTCKTCNMLITSPEFTSNLTGKTYYTKSFDPLDCSTENVIYSIECTL